MPRLPASWQFCATPHRMLHLSALTIAVQISISIAYLAPCRFGPDSLEICPHDWPLVHRYGPRWTQLNFELVIQGSDILHHTTAWVHPPQSQCDTTMITLPQHCWRHCLQLSIPCHANLKCSFPILKPNSKFFSLLAKWTVGLQVIDPKICELMINIIMHSFLGHSNFPHTSLIPTNLQRGHAAHEDSSYFGWSVR